jgi:hypothetical protein
MPRKAKVERLLEQLVKSNPNATDAELLEAFKELVRRDESLQESIFDDVFQELGADGIKRLLDP